VDLAAGLASVSQAISIARTIRDVERSFDAVALKTQIVDLMDKLQDVRSALQDARDELEAKESEISQIRQTLERRHETVEQEGYRYTSDPDDPAKPVGPPFCARCEAVDGRLILCTQSERGMRATCPQCKAVFPDARIWLWPTER
jgi:molybdenum cofactor biosynthesis enzyme MoaA